MLVLSFKLKLPQLQIGTDPIGLPGQAIVLVPSLLPRIDRPQIGSRSRPQLFDKLLVRRFHRGTPSTDDYRAKSVDLLLDANITIFR